MSKRRKLTPFLCQELLYDFAIGTLDAERKTAVEEFLKENAESKKILETIHKGFWYADQLSKFEITSDLTNRLEESENVVSISQKVTSYREYPDWLKWSLVTLLACGCLAIVVTLIPWSKFRRAQTDDRTLVLAPLNKETQVHDPTEASDDTNNDHESSGDFDESGAPVEDDAPAPQVAVAPKATIAKPTPRSTIPPLDRPLKVAIIKPKATPIAEEAEDNSENAQASAETAEETNSEAQVAADEAAAPDTKHEVKPKGFVYRASMNLTNVEDVADQITQQIKELGGAKAGEVELGWKRGSLRYYHFTLPESNQEKLLDALRTYGPVRISKDPHPRVMPEGQVRFILSIDSK